MAEPSDDDKKTAAALLPVCAHDHHGHPCGACLDVRTQIAAALAESREEGRREERRDIVALMNDRRLGGLTIYGLREEIAARGPMGEP